MLGYNPLNFITQGKNDHGDKSDPASAEPGGPALSLPLLHSYRHGTVVSGGKPALTRSGGRGTVTFMQCRGVTVSKRPGSER